MAVPLRILLATIALTIIVIFASSRSRVNTETFTEATGDDDHKDKDYRRRMLVLDQIDRLQIKDAGLKAPLLQSAMKDEAFMDKLEDTVVVKKDDQKALIMIKERFEQLNDADKKAEEALQLLKRAVKLLEKDGGAGAEAVVTATKPTEKHQPPQKAVVEGFEEHVRKFHAI